MDAKEENFSKLFTSEEKKVLGSHCPLKDKGAPENNQRTVPDVREHPVANSEPSQEES
jgi:hypothetical protein